MYFKGKDAIDCAEAPSLCRMVVGCVAWSPGAGGGRYHLPRDRGEERFLAAERRSIAVRWAASTSFEPWRSVIVRHAPRIRSTTALLLSLFTERLRQRQRRRRSSNPSKPRSRCSCHRPGCVQTGSNPSGCAAALGPDCTGVLPACPVSIFTRDACQRLQGAVATGSATRPTPRSPTSGCMAPQPSACDPVFDARIKAGHRTTDTTPQRHERRWSPVNGVLRSTWP